MRKLKGAAGWSLRRLQQGHSATAAWLSESVGRHTWLQVLSGLLVAGCGMIVTESWGDAWGWFTAAAVVGAIAVAASTTLTAESVDYVQGKLAQANERLGGLEADLESVDALIAQERDDATVLEQAKNRRFLDGAMGPLLLSMLDGWGEFTLDHVAFLCVSALRVQSADPEARGVWFEAQGTKLVARKWAGGSHLSEKVFRRHGRGPGKSVWAHCESGEVAEWPDLATAAPEGFVHGGSRKYAGFYSCGVRTAGGEVIGMLNLDVMDGSKLSGLDSSRLLFLARILSVAHRMINGRAIVPNQGEGSENAD